jgi:glycerophosphoryl diester phosphodiesterase
MPDIPRTNRPLLLGHRGARSLKSIPENTLKSFDQALDDGCDGFEFDVRLTADGEAVICHDARNGGLAIKRSTASQLANLARLDHVLIQYGTRTFLDIELKVAGLEKITAALLQKHPPRNGFVVSSFLPEVLKALHAEDARVPLGLICEKKKELLQWPQLPLEFVIPYYKLTDPDLIRQLKDAGKKILVWTVNSAKGMKQFAALEVEGIISDRTRLLCQTLKAK